MLENISNIFNRSPEETTPEHSLQSAIRSGDLASLETSLSTIDLSNKLPNGELPIHFAVREGQAEAVRFLVEHGADPMEKDFQGLTAVDHAFLQKNNDVLLSLLGKKVTEQLTTAINEQNTRPTSSAVKDIAKISLGITSGETTQQFSPLQQAVLAGDCNRLKDLLEKGGDIRDIMISQNLNLLHLAAIGSSPEVVDLLVKHGADLTATDKSGRTAAHYAAINPNGVTLGRLTKLGADLSIKDDSGVSSLALLGASAQLRDPLNITKAHALMFAATVVQTAATIGIQTGLIGQEHQLTAAFVVLGGPMVANWLEFAVQLQNIDKTWKKALAWIGMFTFEALVIVGTPLRLWRTSNVAKSAFDGIKFTFEALPIVGTPLRLWRTCNVAKSAFDGIKAAYNNARYRTWKAARNVVVYTANGGTSINNLWICLK